MKIFLGSDHAGVKIKETVKSFLEGEGYEVQDCGAYNYDKYDDYPDFIGKAAKGVSKDPENALGIVFGGSGQGEAIVSNKYNGVRCALFYSKAIPTESINIEGNLSSDPYEMLKLTREHNSANMLSIGIRFLKEEEILTAIKLWLNAPLATETRHKRRIDKIKAIEKSR